MTTFLPTDPLDVIPLPETAELLPAEALTTGCDGEAHRRALVMVALRQAMADRQLQLPLGPEQEPEDPARLLSLNRFALQLVTAGLLADQIEVPLSFWRTQATAPQLLLAACVDEDGGVVDLPGVLTSEEVQREAGCSRGHTGEALRLDRSLFQGGIDRLLTLVQVLEPDALPRLAIATAPAIAAVAGELEARAVAVVDWLSGQIGDALSQLGAQLVPVTAGAFRSSAASVGAPVDAALSMLAIPLGLGSEGSLLWGDGALGAIERFQLLLIPSGTEAAERLVLRLVPALAGDLLPDGLEISARQGSHEQRISSSGSTLLELSFPAAPDLIEVTLAPPGGAPLVLPPLQMPGA
ncbi:MAG: hypothetical protein VKI83_04910 [Synechococcaceae cyanobacterium]|nr:hypothetical protein [Synechococcaceae cyanobacterium]